MAIRHYHLDYGSIKVQNFPENEIQIAIPVTQLPTPQTVAIDSTGIKVSVARTYIPSEMIKHAKSGLLIARGGTPSATDAVVAVELYDDTAGIVVASVTYAGDSGTKTATLSETDVKNLAGHQLHIRINVTTASATAGATQTFDLAEFLIILGIS